MFFDLNLPVDGVGELARREVVAMALQLGYSGVAANHFVTGVMGETDRCRIRPLELQFILAAAPAVAETAKFHQKVLGVPQGLPFRQFSRITVFLETMNQANTINSANPVLKTYDLVAVRPTNLKMFNHACTKLEVDLISLDFTQRVPFRMKKAIVKAAVERGIYFEICYGRALSDQKARRELFTNSMTLQSAAGGRNIVVCSGARRAMEMRGPNDVANMSILFGFTSESAKNTISRTCKSLLLHGITRKTHKGAIHVERISPQSNPTESGTFNVPSDWDPLSVSGASADFITVTETTSKTLLNTNKVGTSEVVSFVDTKPSNEEEISNFVASEDTPVPLFVNTSPVAEALSAARNRSDPEKVVSKNNSKLIDAKPKGKQKRGPASASDKIEEAEGKSKAKRRKKKK